MVVLKAVRLKDKGRLEAEEIPVPDTLLPEQVLIRIDLTGICFRDVLTVEGYFPNTKYPVTLGHEIKAKMVKEGNNVKKSSVEARVESLFNNPAGKGKIVSTVEKTYAGIK